jgi:hypothetical protein
MSTRKAFYDRGRSRKSLPSSVTAGLFSAASKFRGRYMTQRLLM